MQKKEKIIGTTTITQGYRICLIKDVKDILESKANYKVKDNDKIVFFLNENDEIIIRLA